MPIISVKNIDKKEYRITLALGHGTMENIVVTDDGLYNIYYIKEGKCVNHTGKIINVVQDSLFPERSYIRFDWSEDNSNRRERIQFHQVQYIKDITPNDAYRIALQHGFSGTVEDWLESMRGNPGLSAYEVAVKCGFNGNEEEWIKSIKGERGYSAFEVAKNNGYTGTEEEWLLTLRGPDGKSAFDVAVDNGFEGTVEEWFESLRGPAGKSAYEMAVELGFEGTVEEWYAQNGDTTQLQKEVQAIKDRLAWKYNI